MSSLTTTSKISDAIRQANGVAYQWTGRVLRIATISDIHLGHPNTNTFHITANLRKAFADNEETAKLDMILFAGDVFDRLLTLPQAEVDEISDWIADLLMICCKHNILVRILEGTPSHDWHQSKQFVNINNALERPANLKYVDTLSIETIEELDGLTVLYVPDEWNHDAHITKLQVIELLKMHNLEQVDIACMHGSFDYQLPIESIKNHDSAWYQTIVRHYITIGHVHIRSELGKILAQGSFDRISHGEESAKGHYRMVLDPEGCYHYFVENTGAKLYLTLDFRETSLEEVHERLQEMEGYPEGTNLRLLLKRDSPVYHGVKELRKRWPQFRFKTHVDELKFQEKVILAQAETIAIQPITITPTNIDHHVEKRAQPLLDQLNLDPDQRGARLQHLMATLDRFRYQEAA